MKWLDLTFPAAVENLACDEALLELCEKTRGLEILRFWEPADYFVVMGYSNAMGAEVQQAACEAEGVPVLRRCSGGGTVLQGPGCLNYSLILRIDAHGPLHSIPAANRFIMERNRSALERLLPKSESGNPNATLAIRGHTDLCLGDRKFSGNAQRRGKICLLFHGTFLVRFDLSRIERLLAMPPKQPKYRQQRVHKDFLVNLDLSADSVKRALREAWGADEPFETVPRETIFTLARDKYATKDWNFKF